MSTGERRKIIFDFSISLEKTLFSGQIFSFRKIDQYYCGTIKSILFFLEEGGKGELFYSTPVHAISEERGKEILHEFFNCDIDYEKIKNRIDGLLLVKYDIFECLFSFICSSNNNMKRIMQMVHNIFRLGEEIYMYRGEKFYTFPSVKTILENYEYFKLKNFGYRAKFIVESARKIFEGGVDIDGLELLDYATAKLKLMELPGIAHKVADCICLMGLGISYVVPLDVHIFRYANNKFNLKFMRINKNNILKIQEIFYAKYGNYAGLYQLYIFYALTNNLKIEY